VTEVVVRQRLWDRAREIAAAIAEKPTAATEGTVRAIWESLNRPYRAAMEQGLAATRIHLDRTVLGRGLRGLVPGGGKGRVR
jgi:hypothetical protein